MKKIFVTVALVLGLFTAASAQGVGSSGNFPGWVQTWLQSGNTVIPRALAVRVIHEARDWGQQVHGLTLGQLMQRYDQGILTVELVQVAPPMLLFRVRLGGGELIVEIIEI